MHHSSTRAGRGRRRAAQLREQVTYANKTTAGSVAPECSEIFQKLKIRRKQRVIAYKIDATSEAVVPETIGGRSAGLPGMLAALPDADSRYVLDPRVFPRRASRRA